MCTIYLNKYSVCNTVIQIFDFYIVEYIRVPIVFGIITGIDQRISCKCKMEKVDKLQFDAFSVIAPAKGYLKGKSQYI